MKVENKRDIFKINRELTKTLEEVTPEFFTGNVLGFKPAINCKSGEDLLKKLISNNNLKYIIRYDGFNQSNIFSEYGSLVESKLELNSIPFKLKEDDKLPPFSGTPAFTEIGVNDKVIGLIVDQISVSEPNSYILLNENAKELAEFLNSDPEEFSEENLNKIISRLSSKLKIKF